MSEELRREILAHAVVHPCHVTGMHDPTHTTRYFCEEQAREVLAQLLTAAGLSFTELPRALHPEDVWCKIPERKPELETWVKEGVKR